MELRKLTVENFKCFQSPGEIELGKITLLTGANSSGKSSIIYAILGALQSGEFPFQFSTNGKYVNMGDFREIVFNHERKREIKLGFEFEGAEFDRAETVWVENSVNKLPELKEFRVEASFFNLLAKSRGNTFEVDYDYDPELDPWISNSENIENSRRLLERIIAIRRSKQSKDSESLDPEDYFKTKQKVRGLIIPDLSVPLNHGYIGFRSLDNFISDVFDVFADYDESTNYISSFRLHPERTYYEQSKSQLKVGKHGEGYLDQILYWEGKDKPKFKELIKTLRKLGLLSSMKSKRMDGGRYEISIQVEKDGIDAAISDVGFGISQFMPILVADLQLPRSSTLFVSQPEIHLHPSIQSAFGDYLMDQVREKSKNYVVETHSEYLLNKIRLGIVKGDIKEEDVKIYFVESNKEGNIIHQLRFNRQGQILNAPPDFFKTYMMDVMEIAIQAAAEA